ncbi:hypothetical protein MP228_004916 [Amoeboaphelidium protococcarum]|nr:hypothetical protein MP228_004916 [Amoeboaphelidium protococcarum]
MCCTGLMLRIFLGLTMMSLVFILINFAYEYRYSVIYSTSSSASSIWSQDQFHKTLQSKAINNTVLIVQIQGDMSEHALHFLCKISHLTADDHHSVSSGRNNFKNYTRKISRAENVIFWAYDRKTYVRMLSIQRKMASSDNNDGKSFGVIYDPDVPRLWGIKGPDFRTMMEYRPVFIIKLLKLGYNVLFIDTDVLLFHDPFQYITQSGPAPTSNGNHSKLKVKSQHGDDPPLSKIMAFERYLGSITDVDLVYSTDARDFYSNLEDPLEGGNSVSKICGGLFFARPTPNSIRFFEIMLEYIQSNTWWQYWRNINLNDQTAVDIMLNYEVSDTKLPGIKAVMVGPLPKCLPRWKGMPRRDCVNFDNGYQNQSLVDYNKFPQVIKDMLVDGAVDSLPNNVLKVRMLDQAQYMNGILYQKHLLEENKKSAIWYQQLLQQQHGIVPPNYQTAEQLLQEGDTLVSFHANFPYTYNKKEQLQQIGLWLLDEEGRCTL